MRIISFNANGIRAADRKGFFDWLAEQDADFVCIQETKAQVSQLEGHAQFFPEGYHCHYFDAEKKGYSGVAVYSKHELDDVQIGLGEGFEDIDCEGRFLMVTVGNLKVASLYLHSGTSGEERQNLKYSFMDRFLPYLVELRETGSDIVVCGDWNIVHKERDIKNWKGNQKNSGCLPEERAWLDKLFGDEGGYVDAFREVCEDAERYTWWSQRGKARMNNVGWRIDYHVISPSLKDKVQAEFVYNDMVLSDHAPLVIDYDYDI